MLAAIYSALPYTQHQLKAIQKSSIIFLYMGYMRIFIYDFIGA